MDFANFYAEHPIILIYLSSVNILTFLLYIIDKIKAQKSSRRIRERTLLLLALVGGSLGALLAMKLVRHKTKKDSFLLWFVLILALQTAFLVAWPYLSESITNLDISV